MERPAGTTEVAPDPLIVLGVGEKEVLLVSIVESGQSGGEADHDLLDAPELPGAYASVDADSQWGHLAGRVGGLN
jgi:hypothetical protein